VQFTTYLHLPINNVENKEEVANKAKMILPFLAKQPGIHSRPQ
jgi:hypothetical protein